MGIIQTQIIPYKGTKYFNDYFVTLKQTTIECNKANIGKVKKLYYILLAKVIHFIFFYICKISQTSIQFLHYDLFSILQLPLELNLLTVSLICMVAYFIKLLYFSNYNQINLIICQVIVEGNDTFFLKSKYGKWTICQYFRWFYLLVVNI